MKQIWKLLQLSKRSQLKLITRNNEKLKTYLIYTPNKLSKQLKSFDCYELNKEIKTKDNFGYFNETFVPFSLKGEAIYV